MPETKIHKLGDMSACDCKIHNSTANETLTTLGIFSTSKNPSCPILISRRLVAFRQHLSTFTASLNIQLNNNKQNQQQTFKNVDNLASLKAVKHFSC